jgi:ADP-ribose pyrophosphatase YjhB (NUDIX family)
MKKIFCETPKGEKFEATIDELKQHCRAYVVPIEDGKILLSKQFGGYALIGGGTEKGETLEEGLIRECKEEANLDVELGELFYHAHSFFTLHATFERMENYLFFFRTKSVKGEMNLDNIDPLEQGEIDGIPEWVDLRDIDKIEYHSTVPLKNVIDAYFGKI